MALSGASMFEQPFAQLLAEQKARTYEPPTHLAPGPMFPFLCLIPLASAVGFFPLCCSRICSLFYRADADAQIY